MASSLRPRAIPQCSACICSYAFCGTSEPAIGSMGLGQQVRGKKKVVNAPTTVPVRLLKNVKTFGRKGSIVPISMGRMRNEWFPRRVAEYVTVPELRTFRLKNTVMERNFEYGVADLATEAQAQAVSRAGANQAWQRDIPGDIHASMQSMRKAPEVEQVPPERRRQLVDIFVPPRLDFYRQPIPEEAKEEDVEEEKAPRFRGAAADLYAARMPRAEAKLQAIYGSVTTQDVQAAVRSVMGSNDEAAKVTVSEAEIKFVDGGAEVEESGKVKHVGSFTVEIMPKGAEEGVRRLVKVHAQDGTV